MNKLIKKLCKEGLAKLIYLAGSQSKLAKKLGVSPQLVYAWFRVLGYLPASRVKEAVRCFKGKITAAQLRPDLYDE